MQVYIINLSFKVENEPQNVNKFAQNDPFRKIRGYNHTADRDSWLSLLFLMCSLVTKIY